MSTAPDYRLLYNEEAENDVLSAVLWSKEVLEECMVEVTPDDFFVGGNRHIYKAICDVYRKDDNVDPLTVAEELKRAGKLERVGGMQRLLSLHSNAASIVGWRSHVTMLKRYAVSRRVVKAGAEISGKGMEVPIDSAELCQESEDILYSAFDGVEKDTDVPLVDALGEAYFSIEGMAEARAAAIDIGWPSIDSVLMGLRPGQLMVVGARPAVGKSAWALNASLQAAEAGASVMFFSLEMKREELAQRLLAAKSCVDYKTIRSGRVLDEDWPRLIEASEEMTSLDMYLDDAAAVTVSQIKAKCRRRLRGKKRGLIVIDYLQLIAASSQAQRYGNRANEVSEVSRSLKILAKELDAPVIALAQLNRTVESRTGKRPQLSDLRESGSIEQDADIVCFLDRSMTREEASREDRPDLGITNFIIAKNRAGELADIPLVFTGRNCTFREVPPCAY